MEYRPKESSSEATPSLIERIEATWQRARDHKVIQWSLGYFGVAFVLAQVEQIIAQTYDWPSVVGRVFITVLIVLLPVALTVAWYQGYRGLKRFESAEIAVISGLLLAGAVALFFVVPQSRSPERVAGANVSTQGASLQHVAVIPFEVLSGGSEAQIFGSAASEQIIAVLNNNHIQTLSRTDAASLTGAGRDAGALKLGAEFIVSGTVTKDDTLHVTVHLDHATTHATIWSAVFDQAGPKDVAFQSRLASSVVDQVTAALDARKSDPAEMDDSALNIFEQMAAQSHSVSKLAIADELDLSRALIARAPKFASGYANLAFASGFALQWAAPNEVPALKAESKAAAMKAIALDPKSGAYLALAQIEPLHRWDLQEAIYLKGLSAVPDDPNLNNYLAGIYDVVGRVREALDLHRRAQSLEAQSQPKTADLANSLVLNGRFAEATALVDKAFKIWPEDPDMWTTRFLVLSGTEHYSDAAAMLDAPGDNPAQLEPEYISVWRAYLAARKSGTAVDAEKAKSAVRAAIADGHVRNWRAMAFFAGLGDTDSAFEQAYIALMKDSTGSNFDRAVLFDPVMRPIRRDVCFMSLAARLGLVDYWTRTKKWPDFCSEPGLPYNCDAAAKAAAAALTRP